MASENGYNNPLGGNQPMAVIGMGCRYSGEASSIEGFWDMLLHGRTGHGKVPPSRYETSSWTHPNHERNGAINHDSGFFLDEDPSRFDAPFFSITAKEAAGMDPTQRLLLEVAYEAFENAGVPMETLPGSSTAVYSGCMTNDYELLSTSDIYDMPHNSATGNGRTMLANRLSWFYDLRGPSVMLDTACSSSLTALHLAMQSLQDGSSKMALVTGASLILNPNFTQRLSSMHMLSADGISHSFDIKANGYGRGEGFGAVLLKPLDSALADGDAIRAVIRATGINQDGRTPGITMPSAKAQSDLIRTVYGPSLPPMKDTTYFEAHGTGTEIGDPTELSALGETLGAARKGEQEPLYVGSVKTNIGHTEGAAGVASLIKAVLCLENGVMVPNPGLTQLNPKIRADDWHLQFCGEAIPWPSNLPQRASINSFGFGGSNAHAIVESSSQYLGRADVADTSDSIARLVVFSTQDKAGIERMTSKWKEFVQSQIDAKKKPSIRDLAHTMSMRRSQLPFRSFVVADSLEQLSQALDQGIPSYPRASRKTQSNIAFIFTGQGAQWAQMGVELLRIPVFAASIARSQAILSDCCCPWDLVDEIRLPSTDTRINQPEKSQPICCALQVALTDLLTTWQVLPKVTVGHSSGEIGAAYAAGYLSHVDAIRTAYFRGVFSQQLVERGRKGGMMAAGLSPHDVQPYVERLLLDGLVVACINSPQSVTISGDSSQIDTLAEALQADGHFARKLRVDTAYHSPHMLDLADEYGQSIKSIQPENRYGDSVAMISSVTKQRVQSTDLTPAYWVQNMTSPVEFAAAVTQLANFTEASKTRRRAVPVKWSAFLEIGPHEALKGPVSQTLKSLNASLLKVPYMAPVMRKENGFHSALRVAGSLYSIGGGIDLGAVNNSIDSTTPHMMPNLPSYPWNHQASFWHEPWGSAQQRQRKEPRHDLLGSSIDYQNHLEPRWRNFLRISEIPWVADHVVAGSIIYPAAGMVAMVTEAARQLADPKLSLGSIELRDVSFLRAVVIPTNERGLETLLHVAPDHSMPGSYKFGIFSLPEGGSWTEHAKGGFNLQYEEDNGEFCNTSDWESTVAHVRETEAAAEKAEIDEVYNWLSQTGGVNLGPTFQSIASVGFCPQKPSLYISGVVPDTQRTMPHELESSSFIHPTSLDALFQAGVLSCSSSLKNTNPSIPIGFERLYISTGFKLKPGNSFAVHTEMRHEDGQTLSDSIASDPNWSQAGIYLQGVRLGRVPVSKKSDTEGGTRQVSHYSSVIWTELLESGLRLEPPTESRGHLQDWVARVCRTHGDAKYLFARDTSDAVGLQALRDIIPHIQHRGLQQLRLVSCGAENETESSFQADYPAAQVDQLSSLYELESEESDKVEHDFVIIDHPNMWEHEDMNALLLSLHSITQQDGWLAVRLPSTGSDAAISCVENSSKWDLLRLAEDSEFLLARPIAAQLEWDKTVYVLAEEPEQIPSRLLRHLEDSFTGVGSEVRLVDLQDLTTLSNGSSESLSNILSSKTVISLLEFQRPWVSEWTASAMESFRALLQAKTIIWVSQVPDNGHDLLTGLGATTGLLRTLRNEKNSLNITELRFEWTDTTNSAGLARGILHVMKLTLQPSQRHREFEFRLKGDSLFVPRVVEDGPVDNAMNTQLYGPQPALGTLADETRPLRLVKDPSNAKDAHWDADDQFDGPLPPDQVDVRLEVVTVADDTSSAERSPEAKFQGVEAVGVIIATGSTVPDGLEIGDKVLILLAAPGVGLATQLRIPYDAVTKMPAQMDPVQAVSVPVAYTLAYTALCDTAHLTAGSSVLVVGPFSHGLLAIVDCALALELEVYVAVEASETIEALNIRYPTLKERAFGLWEGVEPRIARLTGGKGLDATVCLLSGLAGQMAARCLAPGGHYIDLNGELDLAALPASFVRRGCTFTSLQLSRTLLRKTERALALLPDVLHLLTQNQVALPAYDVFPVSHMSDAQLHSRKTGSRVALDLRDPGEVPIVPLPPSPVRLAEEHTYLLAGGLGTIGLALANTLVDCGASHLVFLSRSGALQETQSKSLQLLNDRGCKTDVIRCDIANEGEVHRLLLKAWDQHWHIKGILQCATVLKDAMFEKMTYEEWTHSTTAKIQGTMNLHHVFSTTGLDFFITLSSIASIIGNMGQANYSAGNAFMDTLMTWRRSHNLPGQSINVGLVLDASGVGDIAESSEQRRQRYSHLKGTEITIHELQTLFCIILRGDVPMPAQIIAGMNDSLPREGGASWQLDRKFDYRIQRPEANQDQSPLQTSAQLKKAQSMEDAIQIVNSALLEYLAEAMTAKADELDVEMPLSALGVDSLKATEVQNWVSRVMGAELSSFEYLGSQPVRALVERIATSSTFVKA